MTNCKRCNDTVTTEFADLCDYCENDKGFEGSWSCPWMIIYPCGNRNSLDVAQVRDYQRDEWDLASRQTFIYENEARDYMKELGERHGLHYDGQTAYLD